MIYHKAIYTPLLIVSLLFTLVCPSSAWVYGWLDAFAKPATRDLNMNGHSITNLGLGSVSNASSAVTYNQFTNSTAALQSQITANDSDIADNASDILVNRDLIGQNYALLLYYNDMSLYSVTPGWFDWFEDETGVNTGAGSNMTYVAGSDWYTWSQASQAFDAGIWTEKASPSEIPDNCDGRLVVFNDVLYYLGGFLEAGGMSDDVWATTDGITWSAATTTAGWAGRRGMAVYTNGSAIWLVGGQTAGGMVNDVWYSHDATNWTQATEHGPAVATGYMYGGFRAGVHYQVAGYDSTWNDDVYISPDGTNWTLATATPGFAQKGQSPVLAWRGNIWTFGGETGGGRSDEVWYTPDGTNWSMATDAPGWAARNAAGVATDGTTVWLYMGGLQSGNAVDVWSTTDGTNWTQVTADCGVSARAPHTGAYWQGSLWVVCGQAAADPYLDDAWRSQAEVVSTDVAASLVSTNDLGTTAFTDGRMYAWVSNSVPGTVDYSMSSDGGATWDAVDMADSGLTVEGHSMLIGTTNFTAEGSNLVLKLDAVIGPGTNGSITGWGLLCK